MTSTDPQPAAQPNACFLTTHWSVVLSAQDNESPASRAALETLCRTYWLPLYAYVRRFGHSPHDAQDLTQAFFARLLEKKSIADVDPARGRFRSYLLGALKHFLANEWDRVRAQKRGGGQTLIPIDVRNAETSFAIEPADHLTAEKIFERRWALTLLEQVMQRLRTEYESNGKAALFEALKSTLTGASRAAPYAEIAAQLSTTEGAVKVAVHRLRQRYRELLRAEIAHTVASSEEVEDELRNLFAALS